MMIQIKHFQAAQSSAQERLERPLPPHLVSSLWIFREFQTPSVHIHPICYFLYKEQQKQKLKFFFKKLSNLSQKGSDWKHVGRKRGVDTRRGNAMTDGKDRCPRAMIKKKGA